MKRRRWAYYRLHDRSGHVVGYMRHNRKLIESQWWDLRGGRWSQNEIDFSYSVHLSSKPEGLTYVEVPE